MKPSIACTVLLASLLVCSHGIEQQVRRREQAAGGSLFSDLGDFGAESRQYATLSPTSGSYSTLPPTPSAAPTGVCWPASSPVNTSYCYELIDCMETITGTPFSFCGFNESDVCDTLLFVYGGPKGVEAICNVSNLYQDAFAQGPGIPDYGVLRRQSTTDNAKTRKLAATQCLQPVDPTYADENSDNDGYDRAVASILNTYIKDGKSKRTNDDAVGIFLTGWATAVSADGAAKACDSEVLKIFTLGGCLAAQTATAVTAASLEITYNQIGYHDGGIDSSEIAATLENTNSILKQTCNMIGQVDSFEMNVTRRFDQVDAALRDIKAGVDEANRKLDILLCPFRDQDPFTVLGQGCDATDQNCNRVVDECAEDMVPPTITLKKHPPDIPFKSTDAALQFLFDNVIVSDDCAVKFQTGFALISEPNCCDCQFQVSTADERCVNDDAPGSATASRIFVLKVDKDPPMITCGFFTQQDPFHVSGGFDPCAGLPVPFPGQNDPLHIDQTCICQGLFDVALWYQIQDTCDKGVLPVTVRVLSNELEGRPVDDMMTLIVERNDRPNVVHRARVYLSPTSCQDDETSGSKGSKSSGKGASATSICEIDENDSVTTRFYDIAISVTDAAGNVGTRTCSVIVIPDDHYCGVGNGSKGKNCGSKGAKGIIPNGGQRGARHLASSDDLSGRNLQLPKKVKKGSKGLNNEHDPDDLRKEYALSTQCYVISELSLEWDPKLNTILAIPPLPELNVGNGKSKKAKTSKGQSSTNRQKSCPISCQVLP